MKKQNHQKNLNNQHQQQSQKAAAATTQVLPDISNQQKQEVQIQVGLARFKEKFSLKKKKQIIDKSKQMVFQADHWFIKTGYHRQRWHELFPFIQQATCSSIVVQFDVCPNIILDFSKPKFICLKELNLVYNTINNIQALTWMNAPYLENINLQGNQITTTKSLNKLKYEKLGNLDLTKNFVQQLNLNNFKSLNFDFSLQFLIHERDRQIQFISFLAKIERKKCTEALKGTLNSFSGIKPSFAITQKNVCKSLRRKYNQ